MRVNPDCCIEELLWRRGLTNVAGVDEAGRGAWAGPVVAAAVILPQQSPAVGRLLEPYPTFPGIRDSKMLSRVQRTAADAAIREVATAVGVGIVPVEVVDEFGISCAGQLAFWRAITELGVNPDYVLVDGFPLWSTRYRQLAVIDGDACSASIAAASIVAKVARDAIMLQLDESFPGYAFGTNAGYGTRAHLRALNERGASAQHRTSYRPVAALRQGGDQ
jgi:ribonuclease HII